MRPLRANGCDYMMMPTSVALFHMATEGRRATEFDCAHDATLRLGEASRLRLAIVRAIATQEIRLFQRRTHTEFFAGSSDRPPGERSPLPKAECYAGGTVSWSK